MDRLGRCEMVALGVAGLSAAYLLAGEDSVFSLSSMKALALAVGVVSLGIFKKISRRLKELSNALAEDLPARNLSMCEQMDKHANDCTGKVFVISGRHHLPAGRKAWDLMRMADASTMQQRSVEPVQKFLQGKKAVILIPKSDR